MNNVAIGGYDKSSGQNFTYYETIAGGMGARPDCDGLDATHTHMTNTLNTPVETIEHNYPFRIKRYHIRPQSGGTGKFRGGHGIIRDFEFLDTASVSILSDRRKFSPYGLRSGQKGQGGKNILFSKGKKQSLPSKTTVNVKKGDIISICTPGGGGYGGC
jgi:N-methylhydantoinase B